MNIFIFYFGQNCSKIYSKKDQIKPHFKNFSGEHAPEPNTPPPLNEIIDMSLNKYIN